MLILKDLRQISIMQALGFSQATISLQYIFKLVLVSGLGIIFGDMISVPIGEWLISFIWSFMGALEIKFIINPLEIYIYCPLILILSITIAGFMAIMQIKKSNIINLVVE